MIKAVIFMTLLDLKIQIDKLLEDNPENAHKKIVQWDTDFNDWFDIDEIELLILNSNKIWYPLCRKFCERGHNVTFKVVEAVEPRLLREKEKQYILYI